MITSSFVGGLHHARSVLTGVLACTLLLASCGGGAEADRDWAGEVRTQFEADGIAADVVDCVLNVGRRELGRGPLSEAAADELLTNCRAATQVIDGSQSAADEELAMTDVPVAFGDDAQLDGLWTECEVGVGSACDRLFEQSPVGSEYEDFGVSCGNRPELLNCAELDLPEEPEQ